MKNNKNPKWKIIQLEIKEALEIYQIDYKLPKDIQSVKGIYFSIKEILSLNYENRKQVGELSLLFNSRQEHPLHYTIDYTMELPDKFEPMKLDSQIEANQNITGFYIDNALTVNDTGRMIPYTVLIYLECYQ